MLTEEQIQETLERIESGESQAEIARSFNITPGRLSQILNADEAIAKRSARAREASAEAWLDRGLDYALTVTNDPQRARIIAQECARRAALRNPAYREKQQHEHSGKDGAPIETVTKVVLVGLCDDSDT